MSISAPPRRPILGPGLPDDPSGGSEWEGGGRDWTHLTRVGGDIEAHLLMGRLEGSGVECNSVKDRALSPSWVHGGGNPWTPVNIMVRRFQLDDARIVLAEVALEAPSAQRPPPTQVVPRWRPLLLWWTLALGLGLLMSALSWAQTADSAEQCRRDPSCTSADR
jgi:hypothetical protein